MIGLARFKALSNNGRIVIPSNIRGNVDRLKQSEVVAHCQKWLCHWFGGCTSTGAVGSWVGEGGLTVTESVVILDVSVSDEQFHELPAAIEELAKHVLTEMDQEAVAAYVNGTLYLVGVEDPALVEVVEVVAIVA